MTYRRGIEAAAALLEAKARKEDASEAYYRYRYTDSRGRLHPCPASARLCADRAEDLRELAQAIRKIKGGK